MKSISIPFREAEDSNPIALELRQPSFSALIGNVCTKSGENLGNQRIVFDSAFGYSGFAAKKMIYSSLYASVTEKSVMCPIDSDFDDSSDESDEDTWLELGFKQQKLYDRRGQIIDKLNQINASRWKQIGYQPSSLRLPKTDLKKFPFMM